MEPTSQPRSSSLTRPLELLSHSWSLYRAHWQLLLTIVIIPSIIIALGTIFSLTQLAFLAAICEIAGIILAIAMEGAFVNAVHRLSTDDSTLLNVKSQYRFGFSCFWSLVLIGLIEAFVFTGAAVIFIIPAIILAVYSGFYIYARILGGHRGFAALTESYSIVRGRWWPVFGRILFLAVIYIVAALIISGLNYVLLSIFGLEKGSEGAIIVSVILNLVLTAFMSPVAVIYMYKLYMSLVSTRVADVVVSGYKKWLIAFLILGVIVVLSIPVIGTFMAFQYIGQSSLQNPAIGGPNSMMPINRGPNASPLPVQTNADGSVIPQNY